MGEKLYPLPIPGFLVRVISTEEKVFNLLDKEMFYSLRKISKDSRLFTLRFDVQENPELKETERDFDYYYEGGMLYLTFQGQLRAVVDYDAEMISVLLHRNLLEYPSLLSNWGFTIPLSELLKKYGYYFVHAAGSQLEEGVYLFCGASNTGKTSIALGLLERGFPLLSDDEIYLRMEEGRFLASGGTECVKLTRDTYRRFIRKSPVENSKGKITIRIEQYFPGMVRMSGELSRIFFLKKAPAIRIEKLSEIESFRRLLSLAYLNSRPSLAKENLHFLSRLVREIPAYELSFNLDFDLLLRRLKLLSKEKPTD